MPAEADYFSSFCAVGFIRVFRHLYTVLSEKPKSEQVILWLHEVAMDWRNSGIILQRLCETVPRTVYRPA